MSLRNFENQIYQELVKISKIAARAFEGALYTFRDENNPDRFSQAANSLRHVISLLIRDLELPDDEEFNKLRVELLKILEERKLTDFYNIKLERKGIMKKKIETLFIEDVNALPDPVKNKVIYLLRKLGDLHDKITGVSHYGIDINEEGFQSLIDEFIEIMLNILKPTPKIIEELDKLLKIDNPTQNEIEKLKNLLNHPSHVQYFFFNLKNPNWFDLLNEDGFLLEPNRKDFFFNLNVSIWPQGFYLKHIAKEIPEKVKELLTTYENCKNFRIYRQLLECVYVLDSDYIVELFNMIKNWMKFFLTITELIILKKILNKLIKSSNIMAAIEIFDTILSFKDPEIKVQNENVERKYYFVFSDFEDVFNNFIDFDEEKKTCRFVKILCKKLAENRVLELGAERTVIDDQSDRWRQSIDSNEDTWESKDIKNTLVNAIRGTLQILYDNDSYLFKKCFKILSDYEWTIFKRIQMYFVELYPKLLGDDLKSLLTNVEIFKDNRYWHELFKLLKNHFSKLDEDVKKVYLEWVEKGLDLKKYEKYLEQFEAPEEKKRRETRFKNNWMLKHLEPIKECLPSHLSSKYEQLVSLLGELNQPDYYIKHKVSSFISGSPFSKDQIKEMEPNELKNVFLEWNNKEEDNLEEPSKTLFGSQLSIAISEMPMKYYNLISEFKTYPIDFLPYIIDGFVIALKNNDNSNVENLIQEINKIFIYLTENSKKDSLSDKTVEVHKKIIEIINILMKKPSKNTLLEYKTEIEKIIKFYLDCNEISESFPNNLDTAYKIAYFKLSVKWKSLNALLQYSYFISEHEGANHNNLIDFVKNNLDRLIEECILSDNIVLAWFAYHIYYLYPLDKDWMKNNLNKIFPESREHRELWRLSLESYLSCPNLHVEIYQVMREIYKKGLNKLQSEKFSYHSKEILVKHLISAFFEGLENKFFNHAAWYIKRLKIDWRKENEMSENKKKVEKIIDFWKLRIEQIGQDRSILILIENELQWYASFFENSDKDIELLKLLQKVLEYTKGKLGVYTRGVILKLFEYTTDDYLNVLKCLNTLIQGDLNIWIYGDIESSLKEFIEHGIRNHKDKENRFYQNKFIEELTKLGFHDFSQFYIE